MGWINSLVLVTAFAAPAASTSFDPFASATAICVEEFGPGSDGDYDRLPDGWTRRSGPGFPDHIDVRIDRRQGHDAPGSLRFTPDGAPAAIYSPVLPIDTAHLYVFESFIRTQRLHGDAAICSISLLDDRRQRLRRYLTAPVSGTHDDWVRVRIGPIEPTAGQKFLVIGCHLVRGGSIDLEGSAWFDDIRLGRTPLLSLAEHEGRFLRPAQSTSLGVNVDGLESDFPYRLSLSLRDVNGTELQRYDRELAHVSGSDQDADSSAVGRSEPIATHWDVPGVDRGFYRLEARLNCEGRTVARREAAFVVTDPPPPAEASPFGWSLKSLPTEFGPESFAIAAAEAGLGYVKLPLWRDVADRVASNRATQFVERLTEREITVVGLLDPPPAELRRKFAANWTGMGELFELDPAVWSPSLTPLVARHGARVRYWQLGHDGDVSFATAGDLPRTLAAIQQSFERVGRNTLFGVPWPADQSPPRLKSGFVSILQTETPSRPAAADPVAVWTAIEPLSPRDGDTAQRAAHLIREIVRARSAGGTTVFVADALDPEAGLLSADGSPTELFLPWRTAALTLRGSTDLGAIALPSGSRNRAFASDESATIVLWNDESVTETLTPGGSPSIVDLWGRTTPLSPELETGRVEIAVGPSPVFVVGASSALLQWQNSAQLERDRLQSQHGPQPQAIVGTNPFNQGISGTLTLKAPRGWELDQNRWPLRLGAGESFRLPLLISLPADASLGSHEIDLEFEINADRPYRFVVRRALEIGLGDIEIEVTGQPLPDGRLEVVQTITNLTDPPVTLNFRCDLFIPGEQRQRQYVVKLGPGRDTKRYYLPDAAGMVGQELRLRAEQENGRRVLNYRWVVGQDE